MAKVRTHGFFHRLPQQDGEREQWTKMRVLHDAALIKPKFAKVSTPPETLIAKICREPKWNAFMDFFETDSLSAEGNKDVAALGLNALKDECLSDEDNPIKDKHYRPREYMRNQWESHDNPYFNEDPLITLTRLFSDVDTKHAGSSTNIPFQQGGKCSKADRPNDFTSGDIFASSNYGNNGMLSILPPNRERENNLDNSLFDFGINSLVRGNDSINEKAFRNYSNPLSIITDQKFLNCVMHSSPSSEEEGYLSPNKYFKPLDVLLKEDQLNERNMDSFPDGTFFNVKSGLDILNFQRSPSGSLFLESDCGKVTKYFEYNHQSPTDESMRLPRFEQTPGSQDFKVKFAASVNDKASQTDDDCDIVETMFCPSARGASSPISDAVTASYLENENCNLASTSSLLFDDHYELFSTELRKLIKAEDDDDYKKVITCCKYCNLWSNEFCLDLNTDDEDRWRNIWEHHEIDQCRSCNAKRFSRVGTANNHLLEECNDEQEQSFDGYDRLISMESLNQVQCVHVTQSREYSEILLPIQKMWAFARRIEALQKFPCVINSSSPPTRCPVAL